MDEKFCFLLLMLLCVPHMFLTEPRRPPWPERRWRSLCRALGSEDAHAGKSDRTSGRQHPCPAPEMNRRWRGGSLAQTAGNASGPPGIPESNGRCKGACRPPLEWGVRWPPEHRVRRNIRPFSSSRGKGHLFVPPPPRRFAPRPLPQGEGESRHLLPTAYPLLPAPHAAAWNTSIPPNQIMRSAT